MKTCVLFSFLNLYLLVSVNATTWYVDNAGSNTNNGMSPEMAFETIQFAEDQSGPGDSILVANGEYVGFYVDVSGTSTAPLVFIGNGNAVFITSPTSTTDGINIEGADWIELNGFIVNGMPRNGIRLVNAHSCIVRNCSCDNNFERGIFTGFTDDLLLEYNVCTNSIDEHGIYVSNSSDRSIIRYNICHHNNRGGIQINADASQGGDGISTDPEIYGNILYENGVAGGAAINLDGVQGAFIYNNLLYENHATGIALFQQDGAEPSYNAILVHNTIINASNARWCVLVVNGSTGAQVFNNILINQHPWRGSIALDADALSGFNSDYNILVNSLSNNGDGVTIPLSEWQALGYDLNSLLADPIGDIFIDAGTGDFHLQMSSQPVDAGNGASAFGVDIDIEGNARPVGLEHDIGAYEDQSVILALEEERQPGTPHRQRWVSASYRSGIIAIRGLKNGDCVQFSVITGKECYTSLVSEDGDLEILTGNWVAGTYVCTVYRGRELMGASLFNVVH